MRKILLTGFTVTSVLVAGYELAIASIYANGTYFTNSTAETWSRTVYSPNPNLAGNYPGPSTIAAGGYSNGYYNADTTQNNSIQIVWTNSDNVTTCTFNSRTSLNSSGNWQRYMTAVASGPRASLFHCNITNPGSGSTAGYDIRYSIS